MALNTFKCYCLTPLYCKGLRSEPLYYFVCRCWRSVWTSTQSATSWAWALWLDLSFIFMNCSSAHAQYSHFRTDYLPAWTDSCRYISGRTASVTSQPHSFAPPLNYANCCFGATRYRALTRTRLLDSGNCENWTLTGTGFRRWIRRRFDISQSCGYY